MISVLTPQWLNYAIRSLSNNLGSIGWGILPHGWASGVGATLSHCMYNVQLSFNWVSREEVRENIQADFSDSTLSLFPNDGSVEDAPPSRYWHKQSSPATRYSSTAWAEEEKKYALERTPSSPLAPELKASTLTPLDRHETYFFSSFFKKYYLAIHSIY